MVSEAVREYAEEYWRGVVQDLLPGSLVEWHLGDSLQSCESCLTMSAAGPVDAEWFAAQGIYPQSPDLDCHGYNCRCFLSVTDAVSVDEVLAGLDHYGNIGDQGLSDLYDAVHAQIVANQYNDMGLTLPAIGRSWFDAPASSAGSFTGLRYGDKSLAQSFAAANPPDPLMNAAFNERSWFDVVPTGPFKGDHYGSSAPLTIGERQWQETPEPISSTITAPASSAGSFAGERFVD